MIALRLSEGETFDCAGNLYTMLIPRDETSCLEAVLESVAPGASTPPNAHETFVQLYFLVRGRARVFVGEESRDLEAPGVAYIPKRTMHHVINIGSETLDYIYVSIWPGELPESENRPWREVSARMVSEYADRGFPAKAEPA